MDAVALGYLGAGIGAGLAIIGGGVGIGILANGAERARNEAKKTMDLVRDRTGLGR